MTWLKLLTLPGRTVGLNRRIRQRIQRQSGKIADRWVSTVYEVISVKPGINVYCIRDPVMSKEKLFTEIPVSFLPVGGDEDLE